MKSFLVALMGLAFGLAGCVIAPPPRQVYYRPPPPRVYYAPPPRPYYPPRPRPYYPPPPGVSVGVNVH